MSSCFEAARVNVDHGYRPVFGGENDFRDRALFPAPSLTYVRTVSGVGAVSAVRNGSRGTYSSCNVCDSCSSFSVVAFPFPLEKRLRIDCRDAPVGQNHDAVNIVYINCRSCINWSV